MAQQQPSAPARVSFVSTVVRACARPAALRGPRGAPAARRDRSQRAPRAAAAGGAAGAGASGAVELPGGALWWQHLHGGHSTTPLYGDNWVLQRPAVGGPGLVKVQRPSPLARRAPPPPAAPPAVWHAPGSATGLGLTLTGVGVGAGAVVVDTEFVVLPERRQHPAALPPPRIAPNTAVTGIVWQRTVEEGGGERQEQVSAARLRRGSSRHSRRTQMVSVLGRRVKVEVQVSRLPAGGSLRSVPAHVAPASCMHALPPPLLRHLCLPNPPAAALHVQPVRGGQRRCHQPARVEERLRLCALPGRGAGSCWRAPTLQCLLRLCCSYPAAATGGFLTFAVPPEHRLPSPLSVPFRSNILCPCPSPGCTAVHKLKDNLHTLHPRRRAALPCTS